MKTILSTHASDKPTNVYSVYSANVQDKMLIHGFLYIWVKNNFLTYGPEISSVSEKKLNHVLGSLRAFDGHDSQIVDMSV